MADLGFSYRRPGFWRPGRIEPGLFDRQPASTLGPASEGPMAIAAAIGVGSLVSPFGAADRESPRRIARDKRLGADWATPTGADQEPSPTSSPPQADSNRERVLTEWELAAIWRAAESETPFHAVIRMIILTGRTWREVVGMTWSELSPDLSIWTLRAERAKEGEWRIVPLCWRAVSVLSMVRRQRGNRFVFANRRGRVTGVAKAKAALDVESAVAGWRVEDLTRSATSGLARLAPRGRVEATDFGAAKSPRGRDILGAFRASHAAWGDHVAAVSAQASALERVPGGALRRLLRFGRDPIAVSVS